MSDKMEVVLFSQLKSDYMSGEENQGDYGTFLRCVNEYSLLAPSNVAFKQDTIGLINVDLTRSESRMRGLCFLQYILEQCSTELFVKNSKHWGISLTNVISNSSGKDQDVVADQACSVLSKYIERLTFVPEAARSFSQEVLPGFLSALVEPKSKRPPLCEAVLGVLSRFLEVFPGPCRAYRAKIEQNAAKVFDSHSNTLQVFGGRCFSDCALSTKVGVSGTVSWSDKVETQMTTLHGVLNLLYGDIESEINGDRHQSLSEAVLLSTLSSAEPNRTNSLLHLYEGWTESICSHLERKFSSVVKLPVEAILNLVTRALSVLPRDLSTRPTLAKTRLLCVLPFIHVATLRILKALIGAGRSHLIRHADNINDLLLQMLRATSPSKECLQSGLRRFSELRCTTYSVVYEWLLELGDSCGLKSLRVCTEIVQEILTDASPQQRDLLKLELKPKVDSASLATSKKRKRNAGESSGNNGSRTTARDGTNAEKNTDLCMAALNVLRQLIVVCSASIPATQLRLVLDFCLPLTVSFQSNLWGDRSVSRILSPYGDARCRLSVYEVLRACSLSPVLQYPISSIHRLFVTGQSDSDRNVRNFCLEARTVIMSTRHAGQRNVIQDIQTYSFREVRLAAENRERESASTVMPVCTASHPAADEIDLLEQSMDVEMVPLTDFEKKSTTARERLAEEIVPSSDEEEENDDDDDEDVENDDEPKQDGNVKKDGNTKEVIPTKKPVEAARDKCNGMDAVSVSPRIDSHHNEEGFVSLEEMMKSFNDKIVE